MLGAAVALGCAVPALAQTTDDAGVLYAVNLSTGGLNRVGQIGDGSPVVGLAFQGGGANWLYALTEDNRLLRFSPVVPQVVVAESEVTGLADGDRLLGIDVRPATGDLLGLGSSSTLYTIDPESGAATAIGAPFSPAVAGAVVSFDFNPTVDRIRLVTDSGQNLRLNPDTGQVGTNADTGAPTVDANVAFGPADANAAVAPTLAGAGYTNSVDGAESTVLYVIDAAADVLAVQDPPNDGVLTTVGATGVALDGAVGFDIAPSGAAYAAR
jgi:hypothetical protein